ncbi:MAG: rhomboid family intramembrane serine protease [Gemmatimonadetes bacterium]|nr:rhomboid family intramembrane serine protease [Gemmatimonadota bacterium]
MMPLTPWVKRLLLANVAVYLVTNVVHIVDWRPLILYPTLIHRYPWTLVTYMFLHGSFGHIFFNMLGLFFFGPRLEDRLGGRAFLTLYFLSGLGGALFSLLFARQYPVIGASGAVYGVLLGFAMFWPRERIYLWGIIPIEAWLLALLMVVGSLWAGFSGSASRTAHFAHLGGLAFAFGYLRWAEWRRGAGRRAWQKALTASQPSAGMSDKDALARWKAIRLEGLHEINREEVARILAKVEGQGSRSLTPAERAIMDRMAG